MVRVGSVAAVVVRVVMLASAQYIVPCDLPWYNRQVKRALTMCATQTARKEMRTSARNVSWWCRARQVRILGLWHSSPPTRGNRVPCSTTPPVCCMAFDACARTIDDARTQKKELSLALLRSFVDCVISIPCEFQSTAPSNAMTSPEEAHVSSKRDRSSLPHPRGH